MIISSEETTIFSGVSVESICSLGTTTWVQVLWYDLFLLCFCLNVAFDLWECLCINTTCSSFWFEFAPVHMIPKNYIPNVHGDSITFEFLFVYWVRVLEGMWCLNISWSNFTNLNFRCLTYRFYDQQTGSQGQKKCYENLLKNGIVDFFLQIDSYIHWESIDILSSLSICHFEMRMFFSWV